jgi:D-alanine-D-alanine ligase
MTIEVDPDWWKTLFDDVYLLTDARSVDNEAVTRREIDIFTSLLSLRPGDRILDLCGGHGRHAIELSRRGFHGCTVLDYSQRLLDIGAGNAAVGNCPVRFLQGDARHTGLAAETFDHILILGNSLGYIPDPDADLEILRECRRLPNRGAGCCWMSPTAQPSTPAWRPRRGMKSVKMWSSADSGRSKRPRSVPGNWC